MLTTPKVEKKEHRVKENGYSHAKADLRLKRRQVEADSRQAAYDSLTLEEKLKRPMGARQRARLEKQLAESVKQVSKKTKANNS